MKPDPKKILDEALQLEPTTRAYVAEILLESLDFEEDFAISEEWMQEIRRRRSNRRLLEHDLAQPDVIRIGCRAGRSPPGQGTLVDVVPGEEAGRGSLYRLFIHPDGGNADRGFTASGQIFRPSTTPF